MAVTPNDLQALMAGLLEKTASRIKAVEEEKKDKKEDKKSEKPLKGMGDCYGSKVAQTLDYIASNLDTVLSDSQARLGKVAETISVQNEPAKTKTHDGDGKKINWKIDSMATGKDPAEPATKTKDDQVPNQGINDLNKPNGGNEKVDPSNPPLFNKSAALDRILAELSKDGTKEAEEVGVPNQLKIVPTETSLGKQEGEDSGGSHGNNLRHLVTSNQAAMDYTKRDAKRNYIKQQVGEVFDEGTNVEADTAVQRAFNHGTETSKIAMGLSGSMGLGGLAKGTVKQTAKDVINHIGKSSGKELAFGAGLVTGVGAMGADRYLEDRKKVAQEDCEKCTCGGKGTCKCCSDKKMKKAASILTSLVSKEAGLEDVKKMEKLVDKEKKEEKKRKKFSWNS